MRSVLGKRFLPILVGLLLLGFGCKGLSAQDQAAIKPVTVNYWTVFDDVGQLKQLAAEYKQLRPYVTVNIRQVRYDEFDRLFTNALADDISPDIVSMHTRWLHHYQGRLSPMPATVKMARLVVTNTITNDTQVMVDTNSLPPVDSIKNEYVSTVKNDIIIGDKIYGLPTSFDTLAIYYNKDLLDKAGIPEPPKSWDDFLQAVKVATKFDRDGKIVQAGAALGTGNNIDNAFDILSLLLMQNGVTLTSGNRVTFQNGLDKAGPGHPVLQALSFYTDFARPSKESYTWNDTMDNAFEAFTRGKVVFYFGFGFDYDRIKSRAPEMNLEVIPVPQLNPSSPSNVANYWVQSVPKKAKHQNEAWDFVRFLASPVNVKKYAEATGRPSPLRSQVKEQIKNPRLAPFASQALIAKNWYTGGNVDVVSKAFADLITNYLKPYAEKENPLQRDANLIIGTAQVVQQTL